MSTRALHHAFQHLASTKMSLPARLVLLALANRHNQETGRCDPSIATICQSLPGFNGGSAGCVQ